MKSILKLSLLLCLILTQNSATPQQLSLLVYDVETEKAAVLIFESPEADSNCAVYYSDSELKCACSGEIVEANAAPQDQMNEWELQAELFPHPRVFQTANTPSDISSVSGLDLVVTGIGFSKADILHECALVFNNSSGFLEQRLLKTSEFILEMIPQFQTGNTRLMVIKNAPYSDVILDAEIKQTAAEASMIDELRNLLAPSISNSIRDLARDTNVKILENKRTIVLNVPESLLSFALQIKVMGENQLTYIHQALNRTETRIVIRQEQWFEKTDLLIIQSSGQIIWQHSWTPQNKD